MKISIITLFPNMINGFFNESIVKRAIEKKLVEIEIINLRDFATDKYKSVDDRPYGGGAGMILRADIIYKALNNLKSQNLNLKTKTQNFKSKIIITSPKGKKFDQKKAVQFSKLNHLVIISGHYEGVDERIMSYVDEEVSLGDFVMTGGEITASAIVDSVVRLIPDVLKKDSATELESFFEVSITKLVEVMGKNKILENLQTKGKKFVKLLEYPQYTRPDIFKKGKVPDVLLSGNHKNIENWRLKQAFEVTVKKRKDLLE